MIFWLRSLLFYIYLFTSVTFFASIIVLAIPFTAISTRYRIGVFWSRLTLKVLSLLCNIHFQIDGWGNIPQDSQKPLIILGKHQSTWETIAYPSIFPRQLCFVFKRELFFLPFFGWALASLKMIHINRGDRDQARAKVATQGEEVLARGEWIAIYPEGTRTSRGSFKPYRKGGVRLAMATGTDILPVAQNSASVWPRNSILKHPGLVKVSIGPVITVSGKTEDELQSELESWIETEMHLIDPEAYTHQNHCFLRT